MLNRLTTTSAVIALGAMVLVAFAPAFQADFITFDDPGYVTSNPRFADGAGLDDVAWAFQSGELGNWHPLTWLSHLADVALFGMDPAGHHAVNVLLHLLASVLFFLALQRGTGQLLPSFLAAALLAIHPLRVESVAWVSERKDVLSAVFFFAVLWAYLDYGKRREGGAEFDLRRWLMVGVLIACGLMAKPMLVTLPFLLLLLDVWPLQSERPWTRLVLEKLPWVGLAAASSAATFAVQQAGGAVKDLAVFPLDERLANAARSVWVYLGQMAWPTGLSFFYPFPLEPSIGLGIAAAVGVAAVSGTAWWLRGQQPWLWVGWCWYLGMLVPVIGIVQVGTQAHADRYTYLPMAGIAVALLFGLSRLLERREVQLGALILLAVLGLLTLRQTQRWQNSETLYRHAVAVNPGNYLAWDALGTVTARSGDPAAALEHHKRAVEARPDFAVGHNNLGVRYDRSGRPGLAIEHYTRALELQECYAEAHGNLGIALANRGDAAALIHFREAARCDPGNADAHTNLALMALQLGEEDEAIEHLERALALRPGSEEIAAELAWLLATRPDMSPEDARRATELCGIFCPGDRCTPQRLATVAAAAAAAGDFPRAVRLEQRIAAAPVGDNRGGQVQRLEAYRNNRRLIRPL